MNQRLRLRWNGGRNGWASFMVGFSYSPAPRLSEFPWTFHVYLGLFALSIQGGGAR